MGSGEAMVVGTGEERGEEEEKEKEIGRERKRGRKGAGTRLQKKRGVFVRWKDMPAKRRKEERVAARGRGWETKQPGETRGNPRVWS